MEAKQLNHNTQVIKFRNIEYQNSCCWNELVGKEEHKDQ